MAGLKRTLQVPILIWWRLLRGLKARGSGQRESGAFLLGVEATTSARVTAVIFYDDIDPHALDTGIIRLSGRAMNQVWDRCARDGLVLLADVHTHSKGSGQSRSDRDHPMNAMKGHIAFIVPNFAGRVFDLRRISQHRYLGSGQWSDAARPRLRLFHVIFEAQR
jgi:hypothetical protein